MKKILMFVFALGFSTSAMASVCIMQTVSYGSSITDSAYTMICDGKKVSVKSVTLTLQEYLSNGYKIVGQSSTDSMIIYTLVK